MSPCETSRMTISSSRTRLPQRLACPRVSGRRALRSEELRARALIGCSLLLTACGAASITVPTGPHRPQREPAPQIVTKAPPSARVEVVPLRRNPACHYLDGHYQPAGNTWVWEKGKWVLVRNGCYYAPPTTHYEHIEGGTTLVFRPGAWHRRDDAPPRCEPRACPSPF